VGCNGHAPDARSIEAAKTTTLTFQSRGRQFKAADFDTYDYIYVMDIQIIRM
jgi:protein-tyrosine phosphatase